MMIEKFFNSILIDYYYCHSPLHVISDNSSNERRDGEWKTSWLFTSGPFLAIAIDSAADPKIEFPD